ncbi:MAG: beta-galactosidase trimerization domain-containing protein [Acidobacteria bacterium]|nr:beta-galactosidase trimerization domain-containing protein [Acidobacteriota bacterium]
MSLVILLLLPLLLPAEKHWWEREPLSIVDVTTSIGRGGPEDPAKSVGRKLGLFYNAEHLEIMDMPAGLDDEHFHFRTKLAARQNPDYLGLYMPEAKKRGLRVFVYFNVHWYRMAFAAKHPDWRQIRENGSPVDGVYETGADFCVNTPWREWVFQLLRDLAVYRIDGIFFDGPIYRADTCYCQHCRDKFRRRYGRDLPSKSVRKGADFARLIEFQASSLADFLRDSRRVLNAIDPEIALYMNGGLRASNWATARLNRVLAAEQDLLGSEGGFLSGDLTRVPLWKPGLNARLLETQAGGKPTIIFSAASHKPWTFSLLPAAELRLLYADTIANGAGVWFGIDPFSFQQPEMEAIAGMNRFLGRNAESYADTKSEARLALVWSDITANFYSGADAQMIDIDRIPQRSEVGNLEAEFSGLAEGLLRAHAPFDVIDDVTLEREPLDRYDAVFLPNVACMSDRIASRLRDYVRGGGRLLATFETSLYDDSGVLRKDFALADVFGATGTQRIAGPARWDFMKPVARDLLLDGITREFIPSTTYHVRVKPVTARTLLRYTAPLKGRYDGVPALSDEPALLVHSYGRGSAAYFSGDLGGAISGFRLPELMDLVANAARQMAKPVVRLENAPGSLEMVVRSQQQGKRLLVHLVNFTGEMTRPIRKVQPLTRIRLSIDGQWSTAKALMSGQTLPLTKGSVVLPRVDEYEVVALEK